MNRDFNQREYFDLQDKSQGRSAFYFLENVLKARIALKLDTGRHDNDEEVNVYLAGLLDAVAEGDLMHDKPYLSAHDADIREYVEQHPAISTQYVVYKENADCGLIATGLFFGYHHPGSYHHRVFGVTDDSGRIAVYYRMAGSAIEHIEHGRCALGQTFFSISEHIDEVVRIVRKVATDYFEPLTRISEGSFYHLQRENCSPSNEELYKSKLDEFLSEYAAYMKSPSDERKQKIRGLITDIRKLNSKFAFDDSRLNNTEHAAG